MLIFRIRTPTISFTSLISSRTTSPDPEEEQDKTHEGRVIAHVTHYLLVPAKNAAGTGAKSKTKTKEKKETKTKEFSHIFKSSTVNYVRLMKDILIAHG